MRLRSANWSPPDFVFCRAARLEAAPVGAGVLVAGSGESGTSVGFFGRGAAEAGRGSESVAETHGQPFLRRSRPDLRVPDSEVVEERDDSASEEANRTSALLFWCPE